MTYRPDPVIQGDGSTYQWYNCTAATAAEDLDADTVGAEKTTGARVRTLTGVLAPIGLTLPQVDEALLRGWPTRDHLDVRLQMPFVDAAAMVAAGQPCIIQGGYNLASIGLSGSPGFYGNHSMWWEDAALVYGHGGAIDLARSQALIFDPLWDGRRAGIPTKAYRWINLSVLEQFAARLRHASGGTVGEGFCYAGFAHRLPATAPTPPLHIIYYGRNDMIVQGGLTITSSHVMTLKKGQPLYRSDVVGAPVVTKMSRDAAVAYLGRASHGMNAVRVSTANFSDHVLRAVIVYVPASAGKVTSK